MGIYSAFSFEERAQDCAIKFTPNGEVHLGVAVSGTAGENMVTLHYSVKDTGIGIAPERQKSIFATFA